MSKRRILSFSCVGALIGTFMLTGGRLFIYENDLHITLSGEQSLGRDLCLFFLAILVCFGVVYFLFFIWEKRLMCESQDGATDKKSYIISYFVLCLLGMSVIGIYLYAFNPAILYWDSCYQLAQAQHVVSYDSWHPLYTTLWIEFILNICNNLSAVVLVGALFWVSIIAGFTNWLIRITGKKIIIIGMIIFLAAPNQALASITILKDVPYVACVVWMTFIILRIIFSYKNEVPRFVYAEVILSSMTAWVVRTNGFVLAIGFWILLVFILKRKSAYITVLLSMCYIMFFNFFVDNTIEYRGYSKGYTYMTLVSDLQVIYYNDGKLEDEIVAMLIEANTQDVWESYYVSDRQMAVNSYTYIPEVLEDYGTINFLLDYTKVAISNFEIWIETVLMRVLPLWDISMEYGEVSIIGITDYPNAGSAIFEGKTFAEYGFINYEERQPSIFTEILQKLVNWTVEMPQKRIFWHTGVFLLFLIWQIIFLLYKKLYKYLVLFVPIGLHILSLLLSTGWNNYRYFWPVEVVAVMLLLLMELIGKNELNESTEKVVKK